MKNLLLLNLIYFPFSLFAQEGWTSVFIEADSSGKDFEILDTIYVPLYSDSNIVNGAESYKGCPLEKQHNIHGIGQAYDFNEHDWVSVEIKDWVVSTEIDSIFFEYHYYRNSRAEVVDTLIVQLSNGFENEDSSTLVPTKKSGLAKVPIQTIKVPLTEVDSTLFNDHGKFMAVAFDKPQSAKNWAITFTFKSGIYKDSLVAKKPINSANIFSMASYAVKKSEKPQMRFNNGLLLTTDGKYLDAAYSRSYLELDEDSVELYPIIYFRTEKYYKSIEGIGDYKVSIFPTLVNSGETITIGANGLVDAEIFDLNGQLLQSSATNQISTTGLAKGIYLIKLETQTFFTTQRIVVY
jgi:hypothetical protein